MKNKITRKGRHIYLDGIHVVTLHMPNNGSRWWHYSILNHPYTLAASFASFRLAVKAAREYINNEVKNEIP